MLDRLEQIETRYEDLGRQLADPQIVTDQQKYHKTAKAHRDLEAVVEKYRELKQARQGIADAESMLNESDPELASISVIIISAVEEGSSRASFPGIVGYLQKPIELDQLLQTVQEHC